MSHQVLTTDTVERVVAAPADVVYGVVSDVTRTPELSPEIRRCTWVRGATGPAVGARFRAVNTLGRGRTWPNWPVVVTADPGREFAVSRTEPFFGTLVWRYRLEPEGEGTRVVESYTVTRPISAFGYWVLRRTADDRAAVMRAGMAETLGRLAEVAEREAQRRPSRR